MLLPTVMPPTLDEENPDVTKVVHFVCLVHLVHLICLFLFASSGNVWLGGWKVGGPSKDGVIDVASMEMAVLKSALWCKHHKKMTSDLEFCVFVFDETHPSFNFIKRPHVAIRFPKKMPNFHICRGDMRVSKVLGYPFRLFFVRLDELELLPPVIQEIAVK